MAHDMAQPERVSVTYASAPALTFLEQVARRDQDAALQYIEDQSDLQVLQLIASFRCLAQRSLTIAGELTGYLLLVRGVAIHDVQFRESATPSDAALLQRLLDDLDKPSSAS